jgi:hypothetical protein
MAPYPRALRIRQLKNIALVGLLSGFGLLLGGAIAGASRVAYFGLGLFLLGMVLLFTGIRLGRSRP